MPCRVANEYDTSNFDPVFTSEAVRLTPPEGAAAAAPVCRVTLVIVAHYVYRWRRRRQCSVLFRRLPSSPLHTYCINRIPNLFEWRSVIVYSSFCYFARIIVISSCMSATLCSRNLACHRISTTGLNTHVHTGTHLCLKWRNRIFQLDSYIGRQHSLKKLSRNQNIRKV